MKNLTNIVLVSACVTIFTLPIEAGAQTCEPGDQSLKPCISWKPLPPITYEMNDYVTYRAEITNSCSKGVLMEWKFFGKKANRTLLSGTQIVTCVAPDGCSGPLEHAWGVCQQTTEYRTTRPTKTPAEYLRYLQSQIIPKKPDPTKIEPKSKKPSEPESTEKVDPKDSGQTRNKKAPTGERGTLTETVPGAVNTRKAAVASDRNVKKPVARKSDLRGVWRFRAQQDLGNATLSCTGTINVTSKIGNNRYRGTLKPNCRNALKPGRNWVDGNKKQLRIRPSNCTFALSVKGPRVKIVHTGGGPGCKTATRTLSGDTMRRAGPWTSSGSSPFSRKSGGRRTRARAATAATQPPSSNISKHSRKLTAHSAGSARTCKRRRITGRCRNSRSR